MLYRVKRFAVPVVMTGFFAVSQMASATTVELDSESRFVRSSGNVGSAYDYKSWADESRVDGRFGEFNDALAESRTAGSNTSTANSSIQSNITELSYAAEGDAYALMDLNGPGSFYPGAAHADSESVFDVSFRLLEPMNFELSGFVSLVLGDENNPFGSAQVILTHAESDLEYVFGGISSYTDFYEDIALTGVLLTGNYRLRAEAAAHSSGLADIGVAEALGSYSVTLGLTPVPVPAAVWLFASGLGFLGWNTRKQSRKSEDTDAAVIT